MANRGERKTQKSISAPSVRGFARKEETFTPKSRSGAHNKETSVPLSFALRLIIGISGNMKETKRMLAENSIMVNGVVRKRPEFMCGLFDVVEVAPLKKKYRLIFDRKGRLISKQIDAKEGKFKISKVVGKRT